MLTARPSLYAQNRQVKKGNAAEFVSTLGTFHGFDREFGSHSTSQVLGIYRSTDRRSFPHAVALDER